MSDRGEKDERLDWPSWLQPVWESLVRRGRTGRLPGGLLVSGSEGLGKHRLTQRLLQALLCERAREIEPPCGECNACRSLRGSVHPEVYTLQPEAPGKEILIDEVRQANDFLSLSGSSTLRALVIRPADALGLNAANALLKTLEEPPPGAMLILESSRPARLLPTIRSRCQGVELVAPAFQEAEPWLRTLATGELEVETAWVAALGRPMVAGEILRDPESRAAWEQDRDVLALVLKTDSLHLLAARMQGCQLHTLLPRLQALLLSAQRWQECGVLDSFAAQFARDSFETFARRHGRRGLARLVQRALLWQREITANLNPQLRLEAMAFDLVGS